MAWPTKEEREARKAATVAEQPDQSVLERILAELQELKAVNQAQAAKIDQLESSRPRIVSQPRPDRPQREHYIASDELRTRKLKIRAGEHGYFNSGPFDRPEGRAKLPPGYQPIFAPGDLVRVNPDALVFGSIDKRNPEGVKWREHITKAGLGEDEAVGEILGIAYIDSGTWEPKYNVQVKRLTPPQGAGFRESELSYAD